MGEVTCYPKHLKKISGSGNRNWITRQPVSKVVTTTFVQRIQFRGEKNSTLMHKIHRKTASSTLCIKRLFVK